MNPRFLPRWSAGALVLAAACGPDATAPELPATPPPAMQPETLRLTLTPERAAQIAVAMDDFRTRVAPTLGEDGVVLTAATRAVEEAIERRDAIALKRALVDARISLAGALTALQQVPYELDVLDFVLGIADRALPESLRERSEER